MLREDVSKKHSLAKEFAKVAHDDAGQIRKGSGERYWTHPLSVSDLLESYNCNEDILCAACLHDVLEDTGDHYDTIKEMFGEKTAELVVEVTNAEDLNGLSKEDYMNKKLLNLSDEALVIKLGDCILNSLDQPRMQQLSRMKNNIQFLIKHRKLKQIHKELIEEFKIAFNIKWKYLKNKLYN